MVHPVAIVSASALGDPEIGPEVRTVSRGAVTMKHRVVVGWSHQNDTPHGLESGKIWGWTSEGNHFQVYDENFNRSNVPGEVRSCGVANFTMVRMFHPYWAHFGWPPRDRHLSDKKRCRHKYNQLIRKWRIQNNLPVDEEPDNPIQPENARRGRPGKRSRAGARRQRERQMGSPSLVDNGEAVPGNAAANGLIAISDNEDGADIGVDIDEIASGPYIRPKLFGRRLSHTGSADSHFSILGRSRSNGGRWHTTSPESKQEPNQILQRTKQFGQEQSGYGSVRDSLLRPNTPPIPPTHEIEGQVDESGFAQSIHDTQTVQDTTHDTMQTADTSTDAVQPEYPEALPQGTAEFSTASVGADQPQIARPSAPDTVQTVLVSNDTVKFYPAENMTQITVRDTTEVTSTTSDTAQQSEVVAAAKEKELQGEAEQDQEDIWVPIELVRVPEIIEIEDD